MNSLVALTAMVISQIGGLSRVEIFEPTVPSLESHSDMHSGFAEVVAEGSSEADPIVLPVLDKATKSPKPLRRLDPDVQATSATDAAVKPSPSTPALVGICHGGGGTGEDRSGGSHKGTDGSAGCAGRPCKRQNRRGS